MCLDEMLEFGRDTISTSICSTPNHKMTRVQCKNNGVSLKAESQHFATVNNDNPHSVFMSYFGVIEEILELNYVKFTLCVFKCKWVDSNMGVQTDDFRFTLVDLKKLAYKNESFIMTE